MSASQIEQAAVNALLSEIEASDYLLSNISSGDKEPSWDGHIYLYNNTNHKKEHILGRAPVQVKGRSVTNLTKGDTKRFQVDKIDLENYRLSYGVIYFLVEIDGSKKKQIFYTSLLPLDLDEMLSKNHKGKLSIQFDKLKGNLETVVYNFVKHSKKQASGNILDESKTESLTIFGNWDATKTIYENWKKMLEEPNYVYGSTAGIEDLPIKKGHIIPDFPANGQLESISTDIELDELTIIYHHLNSKGYVISDHRSFLSRKFESSMGDGEKLLFGVERLYLVDTLSEIQKHDMTGDSFTIQIDSNVTLTITQSKLNVVFSSGAVTPARTFLKELAELRKSDKIRKIIIRINRVLPDKEQGNLMFDFRTQELDFASKAVGGDE